jgi:transposase
MLSQKARDFQPRVVSLEDLVPADNFYRKVEAKLDLTFVRDLVKHLYKPFGRPGIDPVVFFKLQLIMFFEAIRSERQLMEMVNMRLDHRWYLGYDLNEDIPDHSSLSKIRDRYGLEVFQRFVERIVEMCIDAGLVWGKELYFDGTLIEANADYDKQVPRFFAHAQAHLQDLFEQQTPSPLQRDRHFVHKYDGHQRVVKASTYTRDVDYWVSATDPDAAPMGKFKLGYRTHYVVDGGQARIILAALVTPATVQDNTPMIDLAWWVRFRWQLQPSIGVADNKYGTGENVAALEANGVRAFMPLIRSNAEKRAKHFPKSMFTYDARNNCYICPQGKQLPYRATKQETHVYRAYGRDCRTCPVMAQCTPVKHGRTISHTIYKIYEDRVAAYQATPAYQKAMRKRQVWIEPKFGEVKQWHQGHRFRLRGVRKTNIEGLLKATGQNIKQLLKAKTRKNRPKPPANVAAIRPVPALFPDRPCLSV